MAQSSKDVAHIKKFDGTDFSFWKFQIELVLEQSRLLRLTKGNEVCPQPHVEEGAVVNQAAIDLWKANDVAARSCLISTIEDSCKRSLLNCKTAAQMWTRLTVQFQQNAAESKHILCNQFYQYSFEPGNTVMGHISAIEGMGIQLRDLGVEVGHTQLMSKILLTLPHSFKGFHSAWNLLPDAEKTVAMLTSKLVLAETMNKHYDVNSARGDQAYLSKPSSSSAKTSSLSGNLFCSTCGWGVHTTTTCRKRKRDMKAIEFPCESSETGSCCIYCGWNNHCVQDCSIKVRHEKEVAASRSRAEASKEKRKGYTTTSQENQHSNNDSSALGARLSKPSLGSIFQMVRD